MISVKYFASLRERLGRAEDRIAADGVGTVSQAWARANADAPLPANVLMAVNMEYSKPDTVVKDGDEVAFFPPVTGGAR